MSIFISRPVSVRETGYKDFNNGSGWNTDKKIKIFIKDYFNSFTSNGIEPTYVFCNKANGIRRELTFQNNDTMETRAEIIKDFFSTQDGTVNYGNAVATLLSQVNVEGNIGKNNGKLPTTLIDNQILYGIRRFNDKDVKAAFIETFGFFKKNTLDSDFDYLPFLWAINLHKHNVISDCALFYVLFCSKDDGTKQKSIIAYDQLRENGLQGSSTAEFGYKKYIDDNAFAKKLKATARGEDRDRGVKKNFKLYVLFLLYTIGKLKEDDKMKPQEVPINHYWNSYLALNPGVKFSLDFIESDNIDEATTHNLPIVNETDSILNSNFIIDYNSNNVSEMNESAFEQLKKHDFTVVEDKTNSPNNILDKQFDNMYTDFIHNAFGKNMSKKESLTNKTFFEPVSPVRKNSPTQILEQELPQTPFGEENNDINSDDSPYNDITRDSELKEFKVNRDSLRFHETPLQLIFEGFIKGVFEEKEVFDMLRREQLNDAGLYEHLMEKINNEIDLKRLKQYCAIILRFLQVELVFFSEQIKQEISAALKNIYDLTTVDVLQRTTVDFLKHATLKYYFAQLLKKNNDDMVLRQFQNYLVENSGRKISDKYLFIYFIFHAAFKKWCSEEVLKTVFGDHLKKLTVLEAAEFILELFDEYVIKKGNEYYFSAEFVLFAIRGICIQFVHPDYFILFRNANIETSALFAMYKYYKSEQFIHLIERFLKNDAPIEFYLWYSGIIKSKDEYDWTQIGKFIILESVSDPHVLIRFIQEYMARVMKFSVENKSDLVDEITQSIGADNANNPFFLVLKDLFNRKIILNNEFLFFANETIWRAIQRKCVESILPYKERIYELIVEENKHIDLADSDKTNLLYRFYMALFKSDTPSEIVKKTYQTVINTVEQNEKIDLSFLKNYAIYKNTTEDNARFYFIYVNQQRGLINTKYHIEEEQSNEKVLSFIEWVIRSSIDNYEKIFCIEQVLRYSLFEKKQWNRVENLNTLENFLDDMELLKNQYSTFRDFIKELIGKKRPIAVRENGAMFSALFSRLRM